MGLVLVLSLLNFIFEKHLISASRVPECTTNLLGEETEQVFH